MKSVFGDWHDWGDTFEYRDMQQGLEGVNDLYEIVESSRSDNAIVPPAPGWRELAVHRNQGPTLTSRQPTDVLTDE